MILGEFNFGDQVYIDSTLGIRHFDVYVHEIIHYSITASSLCGILTAGLKLVMDQCDIHVGSILKELRNASIVTQEMTALYGQYFFKKMMEESESLTEFEDTLHSSDYYKMYCLAGFDTLIHHPEYIVDGKLLLIHLARIALSFDLTSVDGIDWLNAKTIRNVLLEKPILYNPDYRYKQLINATLQLINDKETLSLDKIVEKAGIQYLQCDYANVYAMTERLCRQLSEQLQIEFSDLFGNVIKLRPEKDVSGKASVEDIYQRFIPKSLNGNYRYPPEEIGPLNDLVQTAITILCDQQTAIRGVNTDVLCLHHSVAGWHYFVPITRNREIDYLNKFPGEIVTFSEDYEVFRNTIVLPPQRRVFYYFDGQWQLFSSFVRNKGTQYLHIHQVNQDMYCIFVTDQGLDVFFNLQTKYTLSAIMNDITNGKFTYINVPAGQFVDHCFYLNDKDWCKYEDVIAAVLNINMMDAPNGFLAIGRRLQLSELS